MSTKTFPCPRVTLYAHRNIELRTRRECRRFSTISSPNSGPSLKLAAARFVITLKWAVKKGPEEAECRFAEKVPSTAPPSASPRLVSYSKKSSSSIPLSLEWAARIILKFEFCLALGGERKPVLILTLDGSRLLLPFYLRQRYGQCINFFSAFPIANGQGSYKLPPSLSTHCLTLCRLQRPVPIAVTEYCHEQ